MQTLLLAAKLGGGGGGGGSSEGELLIINFSRQSFVWSCDHTYAEVAAAIQAGKTVFARANWSGTMFLPVTDTSATSVTFECTRYNSPSLASYRFTYTASGLTLSEQGQNLSNFATKNYITLEYDATQDVYSVSDSSFSDLGYVEMASTGCLYQVYLGNGSNKAELYYLTGFETYEDENELARIKVTFGSVNGDARIQSFALDAVVSSYDWSAVEVTVQKSTPIWFGTQAQYDAIAVKDPDTLYCVQEGA